MKNKLKISALTTLILTNFAQASDYASSLLDGIASQNSSYTGTASIAIGSTLQYTNAQGETSATNASAPLAIAIGLGASASKNSTLPADSLRPDNPNFANPLAGSNCHWCKFSCIRLHLNRFRLSC